jgi:DNA-binding transcriptional regulator YhcF (GntR family)
MRLWDLDDLAGLGDLARERGISTQAAAGWPVRYPDFPQPLAILSTGAVYSRTQVETWHRHRWPDDAPGSWKTRRRPGDGPRRADHYDDIADDLRRRIQAGEWAPGERIPSRIALARQYEVSEGTMTHPIGDLVREGLLTSARASGTYVSTNVRSADGPPRSRYGQIKADLRARIAAGEWPPGVRLPRVQTLARHYQLGGQTMSKAIADLAGEGLLTIGPRGTYAMTATKE